MSEPVTPDEPTPDEDEPTTADPGEDDEEQAEEEEPQSPSEAAAKHGSDQIPKKLERALNDQRKRLERIIGVSLDGKECPHCDGMGYLPGGVEDAPELVHPDKYAECSDCNGYGIVATGSRNPTSVTINCLTCLGRGYVEHAEPAQGNIAYMPPPITPAAAQYGQLLPDGRFLPAGATEPVTLGGAG